LVVFGIVGMMRGSYREGVTALFVAFLAILIWQPEIGESIIGWVNGFLKFLLSFIRAGFSFNTDKIVAAAAEIDPILDPDSYRLWIVIMVVLIGVSYAVGEATFGGKISPLGRLLGGLIGAANGFVLLNLAKQFLSNYWSAQGRVMAQAGGEVAIEMTNVPSESFSSGYGIIFVLVLLIVVVGLLIAGDRFKLPLN
jgi:hypothetical protein